MEPHLAEVDKITLFYYLVAGTILTVLVGQWLWSTFWWLAHEMWMAGGAFKYLFAKAFSFAQGLPIIRGEVTKFADKFR